MIMELTYRQGEHFMIPNVELPPEEQEVVLNKYGRMRKTFLLNEHPIIFDSMLIQGELNQHLMEVSKQAQERMDILVEQMKAEQGVTEELKANDQMKWVGMMNNIIHSAEEIVLKELVYAD